MSSEDVETRVEGNYLIVSTISVNEHASNPLDDDDYAGSIHGNFNRYSSSGQWSSIGEEHEFRAARGLLGHRDSRYDDIEFDDYLEQAAILVVLETSFDEALEALEEHYEFTDEERADDTAFRAQVHRLFGEHVKQEYNASWPKLPTHIKEQIDERARVLAKQAVLARTVGDKYAVPLSVGGYYSMELKPNAGESFAEMTETSVLWVPSELQRAEYDALPYEEAMRLAEEHAKADAEQYAEWASGNVYDIEVKAYLMEWDDDSEEFIDDAEHYKSEDTVWEESCHQLYGREYAEGEMEGFVEQAVEHVTELQAAITAAKPSTGVSMSM